MAMYSAWRCTLRGDVLCVAMYSAWRCTLRGDVHGVPQPAIARPRLSFPEFRSVNLFLDLGHLLLNLLEFLEL
jgi:hypothetical protein